MFTVSLPGLFLKLSKSDAKVNALLAISFTSTGLTSFFHQLRSGRKSVKFSILTSFSPRPKPSFPLKNVIPLTARSSICQNSSKNWPIHCVWCTNFRSFITTLSHKTSCTATSIRSTCLSISDWLKTRIFRAVLWKRSNLKGRTTFVQTKWEACSGKIQITLMCTTTICNVSKTLSMKFRSNKNLLRTTYKTFSII